MSRDDELVQYIIVNTELGMSAGKAIAQAAHAAALIALQQVFDQNLRRVPDSSGRDRILLEGPDGDVPPFARWMNESFVKIVLRGKQKDLERLESEGFLAIRDAGRTEVAPNSLTVVILPPMTRLEAKPYVGRLQLLKNL